MSSEKVIELTNTDKSYGRRKVLDGLGLSVYRNNVYALLGGNGEGKTTAIRMVAGQMEPDSGSVRVFGLDPVRCGGEVKARFAYVAELMKVYDRMTLAELGRFLKPFYSKWRDGKLTELAETFGLPLDRGLREFSRGMYAKGVLALALCREPELLILDDPCLGLDTASRRNFMEMLVGSLTEYDCTVLLSTHLIPEAAGIVDRVGILKNGRLAVEADAAELQRDIRRLRLSAAQEPLLPELETVRRKTAGPELVLAVKGGEQLRERLSVVPGLEFELDPLPLEEIFLAYSE
ncbi:MAG: ABC transporter ATP-binding protein [Lentisphaeria bacterium]|nr:ABC transporter ATP-binding protein [Lentisphaeria bacterium]